MSSGLVLGLLASLAWGFTDHAGAGAPQPLTRAMSSGRVLGLLASLAWGFTDLAGALAARRVGSVMGLAGAQVTSLAILAAVAMANSSLLSASVIPGFAAGLA